MADNMVPFFEGMKAVEVSYFTKLINKWNTASHVVQPGTFPFVPREACVNAMKREGHHLDLPHNRKHLINKWLPIISGFQAENGDLAMFDQFLSLKKLSKVYVQQNVPMEAALVLPLYMYKSVECGIRFSHFSGEYKKVKDTKIHTVSVRWKSGSLFECSTSKGVVQAAKEYLHEKYGR